MTDGGSGAPHDRVRRSHRPLLVVAAGGLVLLVGLVIWLRAQPEPNVGAATVDALAATPSATTTGPAVPITDGTPPTPAGQVTPISLRIKKIGVSATVVATGVDRAGEFAVPPSVDRVGWYKFGPGLSSRTGSIVIGGHVDSATQGRGAFFRLRELGRGDRVVITGSDGAPRTYVVVAREEYRKSAIPLAKYFATTGSVRLTLITCGGPFDEKTNHYRDNVVVTAVAA